MGGFVCLTCGGDGGSSCRINRRCDNSRCTKCYCAGNFAWPNGIGVSRLDGGCDRLELGKSSLGARLGGNCDTLVDNGLDELVASDGLRVQRRVERVTAVGVLLALDNLLASLEEVLGATGLDLGDVILILSDRSEVCGSRDGGGWCSCNCGIDSCGIGLGDNICCSGVVSPFCVLALPNLTTYI